MENLKVSQHWGSYANTVMKSMKSRLITTINELIPHLGILKDSLRWDSYVNIVIEARKLELIDVQDAKTRIDEALVNLKMLELWDLYANTIIEAKAL